MINPFEKPLYLEKFGLKEAPYTTNPDERYLYLTPIHEEAISMCGRVIQNREGAGLIIGDQGTGNIVDPFVKTEKGRKDKSHDSFRYSRFLK